MKNNWLVREGCRQIENRLPGKSQLSHLPLMQSSNEKKKRIQNKENINRKEVRKGYWIARNHLLGHIPATTPTFIIRCATTFCAFSRFGTSPSVCDYGEVFGIEGGGDPLKMMLDVVIIVFICLFSFLNVSHQIVLSTFHIQKSTEQYSEVDEIYHIKDSNLR